MENVYLIHLTFQSTPSVIFFALYQATGLQENLSNSLNGQCFLDFRTL